MSARLLSALPLPPGEGWGEGNVRRQIHLIVQPKPSTPNLIQSQWTGPLKPVFSPSVFPLLAILFFLAIASTQATSPTNDYSAVDAIFQEHCLDCHAAQDPDAQLVLETFETLMKGGESGRAIVAGKSSESLLVKMIEGKFEKEGKKKIMPPGKRPKLDSAQIALIKNWIDSGALPPREAPIIAKDLTVPKVLPKGLVRRPVYSIAYSPSSTILAVGRYGEVEILSADTRTVLKNLRGHRGNVNALAFSADGKQLYAAAGETALFGEVRVWNVAEGTLIRTLEGHRDAIYSLALSPDEKTLATGSYDQKIKLWNTETAKEIKTLSGHNGAVFGLSFRPDGKILASASGDRTVKLWDLATGERRDTLSQSLKDLYTVQFSPDGKRLFAAGVDNRIRVWEISEKAAETTNPLLFAKFGHEGAVLKLAFSTDGKSLVTSADDSTLKIWDATGEPKEKFALEKQPDWVSAVAFFGENKAIVAGRMDGSLAYYNAADGKPLAPPKPELARVEPRGIQKGAITELKLTGKSLSLAAEIKFSDPKLSGEIRRDSSRPNQLFVKVNAPPDLNRDSYELWLASTNGETAKLKIYLDDLPQLLLEPNTSPGGVFPIPKLPVSLWGTHEKMGQRDQIEFDAMTGQTIVFDLAGKSLGSKTEAVLTLSDSNGKVLASNNGFDSSVDPLIAYTFATNGRYRLAVSELLLGASSEHFYRLSIGSFPYVIACYPLSVAAQSESEVELVGYNLLPGSKIKVKTGEPGEMEVPLEAGQFRKRRAFKLLVTGGPELREVEPNDDPTHAMPIQAPGAVAGRIGVGDSDLFRFEAKSGQQLVIETVAAQRGSPVDTKIEVLHPDGKPVRRLALQAVRNSAITFRGIDSNTSDARVDNWEEMELNEYLYFQGEIVKIFRMPQGPDSGFLFYSSAGKRKAYFDTSATAHALDEPCYVVEPHPPATKLIANGLPIFPLYYANDDDADRKLGSDSKLIFTAPADGDYLVRVSDARGAGGERYIYRLVIREPKPDFRVTVNGANPTINAGSGQSFSVNVERFDGFEGEIKLDITGVPPGFTVSTPLVVEAGQSEARGTLNASLDASPLTSTNESQTRITASALINGRRVVEDAGTLGRVKLGEKPKLFVSLEPGHASTTATGSTNSITQKPLEITIAPGQTIPAILKIQRNGHQDLVTFTVDNLPHGVIVDNIGLNGVLIPKGENERQVFLMAAKWVPDMDRLCFAIENQAGRQTSTPVWLRVRKAADAKAQ